jgi:hypothetical protein
MNGDPMPHSNRRNEVAVGTQLPRDRFAINPRRLSVTRRYIATVRTQGPPTDATQSEAPTERSRMRGPRIADPRNL